jgi:glutathione S-transferase
MTLKLFMHPLSSYCHKTLVALYENEIPFEKRIIDLGNEASRAELIAVWPPAKFPVLRDESKQRSIPESSIIIEYLETNFPGRVALLPEDPDLRLQVRLWDRFYDLHMQNPIQKIVGDRLRGEGKHDAQGVDQAEQQLAQSFDMIEREMRYQTWAVGDGFSMADCAAAPALFFGNLVAPLGDAHRRVHAYLERLMARPSVARVYAEAQPFLKMFPR